MNFTVEQIAEEALSLPGEARALLADRLVESLDTRLDFQHLAQVYDAAHPRARIKQK